MSEFDNSLLIRPAGDNFEIIFKSEKFFLSENLPKQANLNLCQRIFWYYAYWQNLNLRNLNTNKKSFFLGNRKFEEKKFTSEQHEFLEKYLLCIRTDLRTFSSEFNFQTKVINKNIKFMLDVDNFNYTNSQGERLAILSDYSSIIHRCIELEVLPKTILLKKSRLIFFNAEVYNSYSASLMNNDRFNSSIQQKEYMLKIENEIKKKLIVELQNQGWSKNTNPKNNISEFKIKSEINIDPKKSWEVFLEWTNLTLTKSSSTFLHKVEINFEDNFIIINNELTEFQKNTINAYFREYAKSVKIKFKEAV